MQYKSSIPRIKNIQHGYVTHSGGAGSSQTLNFSTGGFTAVDPNKTIMFYTQQTNSDHLDTGITSFRLASNNTFISQVGYDFWSIWYYITLVEFYEGVQVEHYYNSNPGSTSTDFTINEVDLNKTFIAGGSYYVNSPVTTTWTSTAGAYWYLKNKTTLTWVPNGSNSNGFACQIVTWDGARVQQIVSTTSQSSENYTIRPVDLSKAFVIANYAPKPVNQNEFPLFYLNSSTTLNSNRYTGSPSGTFPFAAWVVEAPQISVQAGSVTMLNGETEKVITLNPPEIDLSRRILIGTTNICYGYTNANDYNHRPDLFQVMIEPSGSSTTQVSVNRINSGGNYTTYYQALDYIEEPYIRRNSRYQVTLSAGTSGTFQSITDFNPNKTIVNYGLVASGNTPPNIMIAPWVTSSGVYFTRAAGSANAATMHLDLVEFDAGVYVEHISGVTTVGAPNSGFLATSKTNWVPNKTFVLYSFHNSNTSNTLSADDFITMDTCSSGIWYKTGSASANPTQFKAQVVQMDCATVQRISGVQTSSTSWSQNLSTTVDLTKSFLINGFWTDAATFNSNSIATSYIGNAGQTVYYDRFASGNYNYNAQIVSMNSNKVLVQRGKELFASGTTSIYKGYSTTINSGSAFTWLNGITRNAISCNAADDIGDPMFGWWVTTNTGVYYYRNSGSSSGNLDWESIAFNHDGVLHGQKRYRAARLNITGGSGVLGTHAGFPLTLWHKWGSGNLPLEMVLDSGNYPSQYDGGDIIVSTDTSGTSRLPLEIVQFNKGVDITDTVIEMYVGYPTLTGVGQSLYIFWHPVSATGEIPNSGLVYQPSSYDQYGTYTLWRTCGYSGVWHFSDYDCVEAGTFFDSAGNGGSGTYFGSASNYKISGWYGFASENSTNQRIGFEDSVAETYAGTNGFIAEIFGALVVSGGAWSRWFEKGAPPTVGGGNEKWGLMTNVSTLSGFRFEKYSASTQDTVDCYLPSSNGINLNDWIYVAGTWNKTNSRMDILAYNATRNSIASGSNTTLAANTLTRESGDLWIAWNEKSAGSHQDIRVDEARFGNERTPNYLLLQSRQISDRNFTEVYQIYNPQDGYSEYFSLPFTDNFDDSIISSRWLYYENDNTKNSYVREVSGYLSLGTGGTDIWQGSNNYDTLYCTRVSGDFTVTVKILKCQNVGSAWAKAGLIVRNDMTFPNSSPGYCVMAATPSTNGWQWAVDNNTVPGQLYTGTNSGSCTFPCWVRIQKQGLQLSGFFSTDGSNFTRMGTNLVSGVALIQDVGIVACSQVTGTLGEYQFDDFTFVGTSVTPTTGFQYIQSVVYGYYYGQQYGKAVTI